MRQIFRVILLPALMLVAGVGVAEPLRVGAASSDGEYFNTVVPALDSALSKAGSDYSVEAVETAGSQENLTKLIAGELSYALIQLDVLALNPTDQVEVVELIAPEALLCAARKDGRIRSYYNLTDEHSDPLVISVGAESSGSAATVEFLLAVDPDLDPEQLALVYEPNLEAELDRLAAGTRDMVCFVMLANPKNPLVEKVADSDELMFIDFVSAYGLEATVAGMNVYDTAVVPVSSGMWGFRAEKIQTLTTWMALVAAKDAPAQATLALRDVSADPNLLPAATAAGRAKQLYGQFKDKARDLSGKAKVKALELKEKASAKAIEIGAVAKEKALSAKDKAVELGGKAKDKAVDLGGKALEKARELKDKATEATPTTTE